MQIYRLAVGLNMAFSVSGCPVIRQHMTCHESTGTAPSPSAALPNGLSHGFVSFFVFSCPSLFSFFLNVSLSSFLFSRRPRCSEVTSPQPGLQQRNPEKTAEWPANGTGGGAGGETPDLFALTCFRMRAYDLRGCILYDRMQVS